MNLSYGLDAQAVTLVRSKINGAEPTAVVIHLKGGTKVVYCIKAKIFAINWASDGHTANVTIEKMRAAYGRRFKLEIQKGLEKAREEMNPPGLTEAIRKEIADRILEVEKSSSW